MGWDSLWIKTRPGNIFNIFGSWTRSQNRTKCIKKLEYIPRYQEIIQGHSPVNWSHGKVTFPGITVPGISGIRHQKDARIQPAMEMSYPRKEWSIFPKWIRRVKPVSGIPFPPNCRSLPGCNSKDNPREHRVLSAVPER